MLELLGFGSTPPWWLLLVSALATAGAAIPTGYALWNISQTTILKQRCDPNQLYEDEDGAATKETQKQYSVRFQCAALCLSAIGGASLSLWLVIAHLSHHLTTKHTHPIFEILICTTWILLLLQAGNIIVERHPIKRFHYAAALALASTGLAGALAISLVVGKVKHPFTITQLALAVAAILASISIPRRPDVFHDGVLVDQERSASIVGRYTYSWCSPLLSLAGKKEELQIADLPKLGQSKRAKSLVDSFKHVKGPYALAKSILKTHTASLALQLSLTFFKSTLYVLPQMVMFRLLRVLEARDAGKAQSNTAIIWVALLGLATLSQAFLECLVGWLSDRQLWVPLNTQLSALIFAKSLRRKNVKEASNNDEKGSVDEDAAASDAASASDEDESTERKIPISNQAIINLVGVDVRHIAWFMSCCFSPFFGTISDLGVSLAFLGTLIGWQSLLAGLAVQALTMPLNARFTKKYSEKEEELMAVRDRKLALLSEALANIRQIKFSAQELQWQEKIRGVRYQELDTLWQVFLSETIVSFCYVSGPILLSAVSLVVYTVIHGTLTPSIAFTAIAVMGQIEDTLGSLPQITTDVMDAWVACKRLERFLSAPEREDRTVSASSISFEKATIAWPSYREEDDEKYLLKDIKIQFPTGELTIVSGPTGSGKSLLLASILGEADLLSGSISVPQGPPLEERYDSRANAGNWVIPSTFAFVSQQPWIENRTFRENVLFGLPFDEKRYKKVLHACALEKDLEIWSDGDMTEIGPNGINLSGGQKWRTTLARAMYSRAGILVLDDIFSAVDAHVGKHILEHALKGELCRNRTVVLATHHVSLCLKEAKYLVRIGDGVIEYAGPAQDESSLLDLVNSVHEDTIDTIPEDEPLESSGLLNSLHRRRSSVAQPRALERRSSALTERRSSVAGSISEAAAQDLERVISKSSPRKFVEEETKDVGRVQWSVYQVYLGATGGFWFWFVLTLGSASYQGMQILRSWWIAVWTEQSNGRHNPSTTTQSLLPVTDKQFPMTASKANSDMWFYLSVYVGISVAVILVGFFRWLIGSRASIKGSRKLFDQLTTSVLHAPMSWLDKTPLGRLLNRFTADFDRIDSDLTEDLTFLSFSILKLASIIAAGIMVNAWIVLIGLAILPVCFWYALRYLAAAREVKRLQSMNKSPVFDLFKSVLSGIDTIRSFGMTPAYTNEMYGLIDAYGQTLWYIDLLDRWLTWRQEAAGVIFSVCMGVVIVSFDNISASFAGFALGFTLRYTEAVSTLLRNYGHVELGMNATERVIEYTNIETEDTSGADAPAAWPTAGRLEVSDLVVGYDPALPPVLKHVSFQVEPNQRIGIVGRTGAGKSSLSLALFRFLEAREGSIRVDGLDISKLKLYDVRSRLTIIPQDPVLFSGTIKSNLDPFQQYSDQELTEVLERVHFTRSVTGRQQESESEDQGGAGTPPHRPVSLEQRISEGGENLSQGQRQLLCLARAILSRPKILILDEATSAVDKRTDALIQKSIRSEFANSTLLVIAHRLSTVIDFDKILVLDHGEVVEYDAPGRLLESGGAFAKMYADSGEQEEQEQEHGEAEG